MRDQERRKEGGKKEEQKKSKGKPVEHVSLALIVIAG